MNDCPFCQKLDAKPIFPLPEGRENAENQTAWAKWDNYPASPGHLLVLPKRHVPSWFALSAQEQIDILDLVDECQKMLSREFEPQGYNVGFNDGKAAGQTINHFHMHLIPRFEGDTPNPRGGVRGCIPEMMEPKYD